MFGEELQGQESAEVGAREAELGKKVRQRLPACFSRGNKIMQGKYNVELSSFLWSGTWRGRGDRVARKRGRPRRHVGACHARKGPPPPPPTRTHEVRWDGSHAFEHRRPTSSSPRLCRACVAAPPPRSHSASAVSGPSRRRPRSAPRCRGRRRRGARLNAQEKGRRREPEAVARQRRRWWLRHRRTRAAAQRRRGRPEGRRGAGEERARRSVPAAAAGARRGAGCISQSARLSQAAASSTRRRRRARAASPAG
jgi:hypothetical protein